jgi:hypothetical protein
MTDKLKEALGDLSSLLKDINEPRTTVQNSDFIEFVAPKGKNNNDRGLVWSGDGSNKHFLLKAGNKLSSTESLEVAKDRSFMINGTPVLTEKELGFSVTKSNLREVGRLRNLNVDGNVTVNGYMFYNGTIDRLGLGTDQPNSALSVAEDGIEVMIGTAESSRGRIGTFGSHDIEFVTDNVPRILVEKNGNVTIGNKSYGSINANIHGKLYVGQKNLDTRVDLHVDGSIKYQNHIHQYLENEPSTGDYIRGDIVWNSEPEMGKCIGWVCVRSGSPGGWLPFGEIKHK